MSGRGSPAIKAPFDLKNASNKTPTQCPPEDLYQNCLAENLQKQIVNVSSSI
jgi:hypothetical protein